MLVQRSALVSLPLATALCVLSGCGFEPTHDELQHSLNDETLAALEEEGYAHIAPQLEGALEFYFGTPANPSFLITEEWADEGFDPNYPQYEADKYGSGEFDEEQLEAIFADNERAFHRQLELIENGEYRRIKGFRTAPSLDEYWKDLVAQYESEDEDALSEEAFKEEAKAALIEFYPSLRDSAELYRQQCFHCHGASGGGDGPTAEFLNPLPRDYRKGIFKFTAVKDKARPRRADLFRILEEGVKGTAMPPFRRFSDAQIHGLVDYVRLLAIRGEVEARTVLEISSAEGFLIPETMQSVYEGTWEKWNSADDSFFFFDGEIPEVTPELLARGKEVFNNATGGNCASCHGVEGRGDGPAAFVTEDLGDGTSANVIGDDGRPVSAYQDDWGHPIYPRDLTQRVYRGGDRLIDIYRRIYAGINGTPMPAIGESTDAEGNLVVPPEDMWALVHYVKSLSNGADAIVVAQADGDEEPAGHDDGHGDEHGEGQ